MRGRRSIAAALVLLPVGAAFAAAPTDEVDQPAPPPAAEPGADQDQLAREVQNPIANLTSVPFQNNLDYNIGPYERARDTLNIQPVVPIHLTDGWMVITRTIVPLVYQPDVADTGGGSSGLGDINPTLFLSPVKHGTLMWGAGPAFLLPTATQRALGTGKWGLGVAAAALVQPAPWTIGALASNIWSVAGPDDRPDVNRLSLQYFVNFNLPHAWYLTSSPIITANWKADQGDRWLVPFGGGVGKIFKAGKLPLNGSVAAFRNVVRPDVTPAPTWQLRIQFAFLFPEGKKKPAAVALGPQ